MSEAADLTKKIIDYINSKQNGFAERISVEGKMRYGQRVKSSMKVGSADISAIINGLSFRIEVKIGNDVMSKKQKKYACNIKRSCGHYIVAKTFAQAARDVDAVLVFEQLATKKIVFNSHENTFMSADESTFISEGKIYEFVESIQCCNKCDLKEIYCLGANCDKDTRKDKKDGVFKLKQCKHN